MVRRPAQRAMAVAALRAAGVLALLAVVGCGGVGGGGSGPRVVTSTALLAELTRRVAGDDASVSAVIPAGVDLHSFEPNPGVARKIVQADLLIVNGYHLEESILELIVTNRRSGVRVAVAAAGLQPLARNPGEEHEDLRGDLAAAILAEERLMFAAGDPHFWFDVANVIRYVENIRDALAALDPARAERYRSRAETTVAGLRALDRELRTTLEAVPPQRRKIVVFHDAFAYFGRAYDFTILASVLPANPNQQASARHVAEIVSLIRRERVPTVYRVQTLSSQVLDAIAAESGARVLALYESPGKGAESYEAMMRANARAFVQGLAR